MWLLEFLQQRLGLFRKKITVWSPSKSLEGKPIPNSPNLILDNFILDQKVDVVIRLIRQRGGKKINYLVELPFGLLQTNNDLLTNLEVRFVHAAQSILPISNDRMRMTGSEYLEEKVTRDYYIKGTDRLISFKIPSLGRNHAFLIKEIMNIGSSLLLIDSPAVSRDGVRFVAKSKVVFGYCFDVEIRHQNELQNIYKFRLYAFEADNKNELKTEFIDNVLKEETGKKGKAKGKEKTKENKIPNEESAQKKNFPKLRYLYCPEYSEIGSDNYTKVIEGLFKPGSLILWDDRKVDEK